MGDTIVKGFIITGLTVLLASMALLWTAGPEGAPSYRDSDFTVVAGSDGLAVNNSNGREFADCDWTLNGEYELRGHMTVDGKQVVVPWSGFVNADGERFPYPYRMPVKIHIHCRQPSLTIYRTW